jgi:ABC-2 type transport system ATP-binding protein
MVTHDLFRAKETADHIGIMKEGKLLTEVAANTLTASQLEALYLRVSQS